MELPWRMPLMQAPLGPAATQELVVAVCAAGALGTLAGSWTPAAELGERVRSVRALTDEPLCVNLVLAFEQRERLIAALQAGVRVVSFSWGVDAKLIGLARDSGAFALVQVGTSDEATAAADAGAGALIVQGVEAGGHVQATRPLVELLREIRPLVGVPLVAAGGIADSTDANAARAAGADAVACGTVFLAAEEADVHPAYLDRLIAADASDTTVTTVFDRGWPNAPHRVIRNHAVKAWEADGMPERGRRPGEGEPIATRNGHPVLRYGFAQPTTETQGDVTMMAMYAGTSVQGVNRREPASHIIQRLMAHQIRHTTQGSVNTGQASFRSLRLPSAASAEEKLRPAGRVRSWRVACWILRRRPAGQMVRAASGPDQFLIVPTPRRRMPTCRKSFAVM